MSEEPNSEGSASISRGLELLLAVMMSFAAVGTAWAGFQSAKWSGVQANSYAQAGAVRVESTRASTEAGQLRIIDVTTFGAWLDALGAEIIDDPSVRPDGSYTPSEEDLSGFLFQRFRPEFRPAVEAWLATRPLVNPDAPATPFKLPEYRLAAEEEAAELAQEAEDLAATAREANQRSDNYVLTAVVFALVLFFAGVASRARGRRALRLLAFLGLAALIAGTVLLLTMPVEV